MHHPPQKPLFQSSASCPTFSPLHRTRSGVLLPPYPDGERDQLPSPPSLQVHLRSPIQKGRREDASASPQPLSVPQLAQDLGPQQGRLTLQPRGGHGAGTQDSEQGLPRCGTRGWTGLFRRRLIPSRLSWIWTCPPLACCRLLLPNPSQATRQAPPEAERALPLSRERRSARSATWGGALVRGRVALGAPGSWS